MSNDSANASVIVGLAVGIGLVALFAMIFTRALPLNNTTSHGLATVVIAENATYPDSEAFEPKVLKVVVGVNNTVRWVNKDTVPALIAADNEGDPNFFNATRDFVLILPNKSFDFTFTKAGEFGYHGKPSQHGTVIVVEYG